MSAIVRMPRASSDSAAFGPTPHSARTDRGARKAAVSASATISRPSGLLIVEAIFATCLVAATPMLQVRPVSSRTRSRSVRAIAPGAPPQPSRAADVEERLVDRQRLDQRA